MLISRSQEKLDDVSKSIGKWGCVCVGVGAVAAFSPIAIPHLDLESKCCL